MKYKTIAYQTVGYRGEDNLNNEVKPNAPYMCTKRNAWLSYGFYFWDQDIERAEQWGRLSYAGKYIVIEYTLTCNNILDLVGSRHHQEEFKQLIDLAKTELKLDDIPVSKVIQFLRKRNREYKGIFEYDSIKAQDHPNRDMVRYIDGSLCGMDLNSRIQICIFEKRNLNISRKRIGKVHQ